MKHNILCIPGGIAICPLRKKQVLLYLYSFFLDTDSSSCSLSMHHVTILQNLQTCQVLPISSFWRSLKQCGRYFRTFGYALIQRYLRKCKGLMVIQSVSLIFIFTSCPEHLKCVKTSRGSVESYLGKKQFSNYLKLSLPWFHYYGFILTYVHIFKG